MKEWIIEGMSYQVEGPNTKYSRTMKSSSPWNENWTMKEFYYFYEIEKYWRRVLMCVQTIDLLFCWTPLSCYVLFQFTLFL